MSSAKAALRAQTDDHGEDRIGRRLRTSSDLHLLDARPLHPASGAFQAKGGAILNLLNWLDLVETAASKVARLVRSAMTGAFGGGIEVATGSGHGTTFRLILPITPLE